MKLFVRILVLLGMFGPFQFEKISINTLNPASHNSMQFSPNQSPHEAGPCPKGMTTVDMNGTSVDLHYPGPDPCSEGTTAPYPAIVFAHGFSMFGLSDGRVDNQGIGEHLASWGYVVVIPTLPDGAEERIAVMIAGLDYLESAHQDPTSPLYQKIDTSRMAAAGYSLGGATTLAVSARDPRVRVVVALDPVYHEGGPSGEEGDPVWDPVAEAPNIRIPSGILGAPADSCNSQADYEEIYPLIGASLKASYQIVDASHCVFTVPGSSFCSLTCEGALEPYMTALSQKYMTAWFNFHLRGKSEDYTYLYGPQAQADIEAGLIIRQVETFPILTSAELTFVPFIIRE